MNVWFVNTLLVYPKLDAGFLAWAPLSILLKDENEVWVCNKAIPYDDVLAHEWGHNLGLWDRYGRHTDGKDYLMGKSTPDVQQVFLRSKDILDARQQAHDLREELGLGN
jgi:hypothetical protein